MNLATKLNEDLLPLLELYQSIFKRHKIIKIVIVKRVDSLCKYKCKLSLVTGFIIIYYLQCIISYEHD